MGPSSPHERGHVLSPSGHCKLGGWGHVPLNDGSCRKLGCVCSKTKQNEHVNANNRSAVILLIYLAPPPPPVVHAPFLLRRLHLFPFPSIRMIKVETPGPLSFPLPLSPCTPPCPRNRRHRVPGTRAGGTLFVPAGFIFSFQVDPHLREQHGDVGAGSWLRAGVIGGEVAATTERRIFLWGRGLGTLF